MSDLSPDPAALLARAAKLRLFVMLRQTKNASSLRDGLGAHLQWMIGQEQAGSIFLSGPIAPSAGAAALDGLTIIRAGSLEEAEVIAREDPFVQSGAVTFEMREWTVNEGSIAMTVTLSDSSVRLP